MKKLKDILNESQHLSYRRMNVGEEKEEKGMTNEEKKEFLKAVSEYKKFGESIYRSGNLAEVYESVKGIVETAHKVTLEETGDWFDKVTVNRHMKSMNESFKVFEKTIHEVNTLQQRLESCYDEMGEVLGKYYEIKEGNEFGAARAKAIAKGADEFEVDGKKFPVKDVDKDDKENAKKFAKESVLNERRASAKKLLQSVVAGETDSVEGIKMSKEMAQSFLDWQRLSPFGKKYGDLPFNRLFTAAFSFGLNRYADKKSKEYKELEAKANQMFKARRGESVNEGYVKSMGYKAVNDRIVSLTKSLDPNGILCKNISKNADNVKPEFKQMKKYIDAIDQLWGEVEYVIAMSNESVNEGKHDDILDKLADIVKGAKSFMDIGKELKKNGIKYSFGTNMIPMYIIDKPTKIAILNNKYADGAERVVGDTAIGLMESLTEEAHSKATLDTIARRMFSKSYSRLTMDQAARVKAALREVIEEGSSMKLTDIINESKYTVINPKNGNVMGAGLKDQAAKLSKKMGGEKKGYYVIPMSNAKKARRALEKFNFDLKNQKLHSMLGDLYFESADEPMNEGASSEEKRIVMMAVRKIAKYRNVDIKTAVVDVMRAAEELERDIQKGKVKK
jgi:hypothetical protein